jgi:ribosomal protein L22
MSNIPFALFADLIHVGQGTHRKMVWPHGRGKSGIRRNYFSHLTVRLPTPHLVQIWLF